MNTNNQRNIYNDSLTHDEQSSSDDDNYSSSESSSYDSESDSSASDKDSSIDDDDDDDYYQTTTALSASSPSPSYHDHPSHHYSSTMRQRRRGRQTHLLPHQQRDIDVETQNHSSPPKTQRNAKVKRRKGSTRKKRSRHNFLLKIYYLWCRVSSYFLMLAVVLWILVQIYYLFGMMLVSSDEQQEKSASARSRQYPRSNHLEPMEGFWPPQDDQLDEEGENNHLASWFGFTNKKKNKKKKRDKEAIPDGCELQEWQQIAHPNCMELHQLDLPWLLREAFQNDQTADGNKSATSLPNGKYLSSGMWRDVFRLSAAAARYPEIATNSKEEHTVLKMMKSEHDVDLRNLERHKREAIVMDILTKSPNIVNLFAYCGNSVLTEYLPMDLETYLRPKMRKKRRRNKKKLVRRRGQPTIHHDEPTPEDEAPSPLVTTPEERLDLAFQTVKALDELHQNDIIHADLQSKQFLVDLGGGDGHSNVTIKLNDFNRCRFLPREMQNVTAGNNSSSSNLSNLPRNSTTLLLPPICPILIPTAPGLARSPEEYDMLPLTTQLDVFSLANVWYQILTGSTPWADQANTNVVKNLIMHGKKPPLSEDQTKSTSDAVLADLLHAAYEVDPNQRATARDLIEGLKGLL